MRRPPLLLCLLLSLCALVGAGEGETPTEPTVQAVLLLRTLEGVKGSGLIVTGNAAQGLMEDMTVKLRLGFSAAAGVDTLAIGTIYRVHLRRIPDTDAVWEAVEPLVALPVESDPPPAGSLPGSDSFQQTLRHRLESDGYVTGSTPLATPATGTPDEAAPAAPPIDDPATDTTTATPPRRFPIRVLRQGRRCLIAYEGQVKTGAAMVLDGGETIAVTVQCCDGTYAVIECVGSPILPERCYLQQVATDD